MKKKVLVLAMSAIFAVSVVSGTLAYFTTEEKAHNVITTGGVGIEIIEKTKDSNGAEVDFPKEGVNGVMPGTAVSKIVKIKNSGADEAWIRVTVEADMVNAEGKALPLTIEKNQEPVMEYEVLDGWIDGGDGYYYYEKPVSAGAYTGILFKEVTFHPAMDNTYQDCKANIIISAQAVQTANNGSRVTEAKGWPEN